MSMASTRWILLAASVACGQEYDVVGGPVDVDPADVLACDFSPIPDTKFSVYDCNPVFSGTEEDWGEGFVSVGFRTQTVLGHPFYQIWYTADDGDGAFGNYGLGYAISGDGTHWEVHEANPIIDDDRGWDASQMDQVRVVWDADTKQYVLAYQGFNTAAGTWGLGMFTSADGIHWNEFNDGEPVLDFTRPAATDVTYCWPVGFSWTEEDGYSGYLGGQPPSGRNVCQIYAFQGDDIEDGLDLERDVVLRAGPEDYDAAGMASAATVLYDDTWYMFYVGFESWVDQGTYQTSLNHSLNLATSTDGVTWEKHPDNPMPIALTEPGVIGEVAAQLVGSRIHLWITDEYEDIDQSAVGYYLFEPDIPDHE